MSIERELQKVGVTAAHEERFSRLYQTWMEEHASLDVDPEWLRLICYQWFTLGALAQTDYLKEIGII